MQLDILNKEHIGFPFYYHKGLFLITYRLVSGVDLIIDFRCEDFK